jgi:predicted RND superfamily exporter protein
MDKFSQAVINHRKGILAAFLIAAVLGGLLSVFVHVNFDTVDYLPADAQSTTAIRIMKDEFGGEMPNAKVMITDVSIHGALEYKARIAAVEGVTGVSWLDDVIGHDTLKTTPVEFLDASIVESYYKDGNALISLTIESGQEQSAVGAIYEIIGEENAAAGEAVSMAESQAMSVSEVANAMVILIPVVFIILVVSTGSWAEPLLFLVTIGAAILINMGTNILFGEISFITRTVSPVLQLAVSLDYTIFLLHSFNNHRKSLEPGKAMQLAMKESLSTVAASAATTMFGFAALIFMRFGIGADLGLNLLKGIAFSFISAMVLLPAITMMSYKFIDKTRHRRLLPDFNKVGGVLMKIRIPFLVLALLIVVPCFLAQSNTRFLYGTGNITKATRVGKDTAFIEEKFGRQNTLALLVPKGDAGTEAELSDELSRLSHVTSVISYSTAVGAQLPVEFVPEEAVKQFYSENYARIIINTDMEDECTEVFDTVRSILDKASEYYDEYWLAGQSASLHDMKDFVSVDNRRVSLIAIIGISLVLLATFRSVSLPFLLVFTIETAIWINLSFPYFTGDSLNFIGFLIISTVQLGATVDYAILFTNAYLANRKKYPKKEAMLVTIQGNLAAVLISAVILATAGFILAFTSNNPIIIELGMLLGRGTLLSFVMVACVLPALLVLFDKVIRKTTLNNRFHGIKNSKGSDIE